MALALGGCNIKRPPRPKLHVLDFIVLDSKTKLPVNFTLNTEAIPLNTPLLLEVSLEGRSRMTWLGPYSLPVKIEAEGYAPAELEGGFVKVIDRFTTAPRVDSAKLILLEKK